MCTLPMVLKKGGRIRTRVRIIFYRMPGFLLLLGLWVEREEGEEDWSARTRKQCIKKKGFCVSRILLTHISSLVTLPKGRRGRSTFSEERGKNNE